MWGISPEPGKSKNAKPLQLELRWTAPEVKPSDPYTVLLSLKTLLDAGALTQAEYDAKKGEQLAKIPVAEPVGTAAMAVVVPVVATPVVLPVAAPGVVALPTQPQAKC